MIFTLILPLPSTLTYPYRIDILEIESILGIELWYLWFYLLDELNAINPKPDGFRRFVTSCETDLQIKHSNEPNDRGYFNYVNNAEVINEILAYIYAHMRQHMLNIIHQRPIIRSYDPTYLHIGLIGTDSIIIHLFENEGERNAWLKQNNAT